jgi:hypothetical protein
VVGPVVFLFDRPVAVSIAPGESAWESPPALPPASHTAPDAGPSARRSRDPRVSLRRASDARTPARVATLGFDSAAPSHAATAAPTRPFKPIRGESNPSRRTRASLAGRRHSHADRPRAATPPPLPCGWPTNSRSRAASRTPAVHPPVRTRWPRGPRPWESGGESPRLAGELKKKTG